MENAPHHTMLEQDAPLPLAFDHRKNPNPSKIKASDFPSKLDLLLYVLDNDGEWGNITQQEVDIAKKPPKKRQRGNEQDQKLTQINKEPEQNSKP